MLGAGLDQVKESAWRLKLGLAEWCARLAGRAGPGYGGLLCGYRDARLCARGKVIYMVI